MECSRCGRPAERAIGDPDGCSQSVQDTVPVVGEAQERVRLFRFVLFTADTGASEIRMRTLCEECARRLAVLVWQFYDGRLVVLDHVGEEVRLAEAKGVM
jgi:hypothetical protein